MKQKKICDLALVSVLILLFQAVGCSAQVNRLPNELHPLKICDLGRAIEWCDSHIRFSSSSPEGIWDFPEDNMRVLIVSNNEQKGNIEYPSFDIIAIESPDCRLKIGGQIGVLYALPEKNKFKLSLMTRRKGLNLVSPRTCLAQITTDGKGMLIKRAKFKFTLNPSIILGKFWRIAKIRVDDPLANTPTGMIRRYPNPDNSPYRDRYGLLYF